MIALTATTDVLELVLSGAVSTTQLDWVASYADITTPTTTPTAFVLARSDGISNNTSTVVLIASPASTHQRQLKFFAITNRDVAPSTVQIKFNDNGTRRLVYGATLQPGYTLTYTDGAGWQVATTTGAILTAPQTNLWIQGDAVTLTNAQVIAIPTAPITIIPAPAAGLWISDFSITYEGRFTLGAYTVDAAAFLWLRYSGGDQASNYVANDATLTPARTGMTDLFAAVNKGGLLTPWQDTVETNQWGNLSNVIAPPTAQHIELTADNGGAVNFTGGNAGNTFVFRPVYLLTAVP